ncbi:unnamed protein product [Rotaria sordida]|uniref:Uncharacterized protein n=1 Tax=Rotaria sordida TaxID=392033 RepID=A0A815LLX8_9BILA|nr:unnamed protein product [Rotaria sordida]
MAVGGGDEKIAQRVLRLTDIVEEPTDFLMPISGYEKMPIVSLEEAVEPLIPLLPSVKSYAYAAKKKCKKPADNLTQDESASIMLYSMGWEPLNECLYCALNATLRSKNRSKLKPWFLYLRLFLAALFCLPPLPPLTVFRGVKLDLSAQFQKGETVVWWGFSSCTTSIEVLQMEEFLGMTDASKSSQQKPVSAMSTPPKSNHEIDHPTAVDIDVRIEEITNRIIQILGLDDEDKNKILRALLKNGRQSLINYQKDIISKIYKEQMNGNDNELMTLLKKYFERKWEVEYDSSNAWFIVYLKQCKNNDNVTYETVLTRTAEYGNKYMKNCPILSIILQILFKDIDNKCLQEKNLFNDLWLTITNDGLKSIIEYSKYIASEIINELINEKQSILFQALREYYRQELFRLFQQNNIADKENLYDLALDNIVEYGWIDGIKAIEDTITPKKFEMLLDSILLSFNGTHFILNYELAIY